MQLLPRSPPSPSPPCSPSSPGPPLALADQGPGEGKGGTGGGSGGDRVGGGMAGPGRARPLVGLVGPGHSGSRSSPPTPHQSRLDQQGTCRLTTRSPSASAEPSATQSPAPRPDPAPRLMPPRPSPPLPPRAPPRTEATIGRGLRRPPAAEGSAASPPRWGGQRLGGGVPAVVHTPRSRRRGRGRRGALLLVAMVAARGSRARARLLRLG